jgi:hypothetical protein
MSPPADDVPRTPDRRSSTQALFTAFRTLTGGRLKSPTPPPTASPSTSTPTETPSLGAARPASGASPRSADGSLQRITQLSQRNAQPITGGPPELDGLVAQLHHGRPYAERAGAVEKICKILDEYPVRNTLGLWSVASDLLLPEQPDDVAETGYKLLQSCASLPQLTAVERNVFFDAVSLRKNDRHFDRRLHVVTALTNGGRDIEACETFIFPFIVSSFETCFGASHEASNTRRKATGKRSVDKPTREAENMARLFQFAIDICKFNAKVLTDDDLELLLGRVTAICRETVQADDIENCIRVFDTVIVYVHVPIQVVTPCVEVLCAIHEQLQTLQEQTWGTLSNLFKSHVGDAAVSSLLHTLYYDPARKTPQSSLYKRATLRVLQRLLVEDGSSGLPKVPLSLLFPAMLASIKEPHQTQEGLVVELIGAVLAQESLKEVLLAEFDFSDLISIISTCAERDDDRHRAKATSTSILAAGKKDTEGRGLAPIKASPLNNGRCWSFNAL